MKKKRKVKNALSSVSTFVQAYLGRIKELFHLARLEAKLAYQTLLVIGILVFALGSLLTATWLSVLAMVFFYLVNLSYGYFSAACVVFGINALTMMLVVLLLYRIKCDLTFQQTRKQIQIEQQELTDEKITEKN